MIHIRELDHVVLRVAALEPMVDFYCRVLGCAVERRLDIGLVQLRAGRSLIDLVPVESEIGRRGGGPPAPEGRNVDHFCVRVEPFDEAAIRAHLAAHGARAGETATRYGAEGSGPSIYVTDPEGNTVELKGPPEAGPVHGSRPPEAGPVHGSRPPEAGPVHGSRPPEAGPVHGSRPPEAGPVHGSRPPEGGPVGSSRPPEGGP